MKSLSCRARAIFTGGRVLSLAAVAGLVVTGAATFPASPAATITANTRLAASTSYSLWPTTTVPAHPSDPDSQSVTLGVMFSSSVAGDVSGIRFYQSRSNLGTHVGKLWTSGGQQLASVIFPASSTAGWKTARFSTPVTIKAGTAYIASYSAPQGHYADDSNALSPTQPRVSSSLTATKGVYSYGAGMPSATWQNSNYYVDVTFAPAATAPTSTPTSAPSPTPTPTPAPTPAPTQTPSASFPDASNTGPTGTLTPTSSTWTPVYVTTDGTTIDSKRVNGDLIIRASNVTVTNSEIDGRVVTDTPSASVTITDSLINGGAQEQFPSVSYHDVTLKRSEVIGGEHSVQCNSNCTVIDSYLHDQYLPAGSSGHVEAFISNGGKGFVLRHNTLHCTPQPTNNSGACTADVSVFGDFEPISDVTIDDNLFKSNATGAGYCLYAGYNPSKPYGSNPSRVTITNNVFERGSSGKCGIWGAVTSYLNANGNTFTGNTYTDGTAVSAGMNP